MRPKFTAGVIKCPSCRCIFVNRYRHRCPRCKTLLFFPGEFFSQDSEGYFWYYGKWCKTSDVEKLNPEVVKK